MRNNYDRIARYYDVLSRMVFFRAQLKAQIDQLHFIPANSSVLIVGGGTGWILEEIAKVHSSGLRITYVEISAKMLDLSRKRKVGANEVTFVHSPAEELGNSIPEDQDQSRAADLAQSKPEVQAQSKTEVQVQSRAEDQDQSSAEIQAQSKPEVQVQSRAEDHDESIPEDQGQSRAKDEGQSSADDLQQNAPATYDVVLTAFLFDNFQQQTITKVFNLLHQKLNPGGFWLFSDFYHSEGKKWQSYLLKAMYIFFKQISNIEARQLLSTEHCFHEQSYHILQTRFYYGKFIKAVVYQKT